MDRVVMQAGPSSTTSITAMELIQRLSITEDDLGRVRAMGRRVLPAIGVYVESFYGWMQTQPEWAVFFSDPGRLKHVQDRQLDHWRDLFAITSVDEDYLARRTRIGQIHARIGLSLIAYFAGIERSLEIFTRQMPTGDLSPEELAAEHASFAKLLHADALVTIHAYNVATQRTIEAQAEALLEMSTPVAELWEAVLLLPIVGVIDSARAEDIMSSVLEHVATSRARVLVIDISGVPVVDTAVADHLVKITRASRLMGCDTILSGLSGSIARTIVELGIDIEGVETTSTLRDATTRAYRRVGLKLAPIDDRSDG